MFVLAILFLILLLNLRRDETAFRFDVFTATLSRKIACAAVLIGLSLLLYYGPIFFDALMARLLKPEDFGMMSIVSAYTSFFLAPLVAIILIVMLLYLSPSHKKPHQTG